ncbi:MAG: FAD-binding protein [Rhodobacteraceae bacterium]|nr:FAD-binding protein [Paracoccaceae bacterium]
MLDTLPGEAEIADRIRAATGPLRIIGGGTRSIGVTDGAVLETSATAGVRLYEPGALTVVAGAGTSLDEIETLLASENQALPFEPPRLGNVLGKPGNSTIGGVVAANASGPRRIQVGACRDSLIGVRFVDGRGDVIKNGGRVMKNVTGYDLVKLLAGSYGTLGVLTEVAFKVLPAPASRATLRVTGLNVADAIRAMSAALGSPFEVNGAAHIPSGEGGQPETLMRIEGFAESVTYRLGRLTELLAPFEPVSTEEDPAAISQIWEQVRDVTPFADVEGDLWRLSVKPSDGAEVAARLPEAQLMFDWGGGLIWAIVPTGCDLRAAVQGIPGHATLMRASDDTKASLGVFHPDPAPLAAISTKLRSEFDPRGTLNPGLMG